jgi:hypothetical protein
MIGKIPRWGLVAAATLLWSAAAPPPACAATTAPYTATSVAIGHPYGGVWVTNDTGQVSVHGDAQVFKVDSSNARLTGRRTVLTDGTFNADGSTILYGTAFQELGAWDITDPQNPRVTPGAGRWEMNWRGTMNADTSIELSLVGTGTGGAIEGMRITESLTRPAGPLFDPALSFTCRGSLTTPPLSTATLIDDFEDGKATAWTPGCNSGSIAAVETNGKLILRGNWPGTQTVTGYDTAGWVMRPFNWTAKNNETLELRVDLVRISDAATEAEVKLKHVPACYGFSKSQRYVMLWKFVPDWPVMVFTFEPLALKNTNVTLVLALTGRGPDLIVTGRVLDKANDDAILYERSIVDTPNADPTLSADEFEERSGARILLGPDRAEPPLTTIDYICLSLFQYTDGHSPPAEVIFDNCEIRRHSVPSLSIANAVRLTWPAVAAPFAVEGASAVTGPWLPVLEPVFESGNMKQVTVPTADAMKLFRLK